MDSAFRLAVRIAAAIVVVSAAFPSRADCVDGVREATAAERAFQRNGLAALTAALPGPPAGMERLGRPPYDFKGPLPVLSLCRDTKQGDFDLVVSTGFLYTFPKAEADRLSAERRLITQKIREGEALPTDREAERRALEDQARAVYAQAPRRRRSDPPFTPAQQAEVDLKLAEGRTLERQARAVVTAHLEAMKPRLEPLHAEAARLSTAPQTFTVSVGLNSRSFPSPAGRQPKAYDWTSGVPAPNRSAGLRVLNVAFSVGGPEGPARAALVEAIDARWLQALVGQPLPDVAVSEAQAAKRTSASR